MNKIFGILTLSSIAFLAACNDREQSSQERGSATQEQNMQRAMDAIPVPQVTQYTTRETVSRWIEQSNEPDQTHYVYVMLPGVGFIGYYVADSAIVNICTSLTPPQRLERMSPHNKGSSVSYTDVLVSSPGLDGVYYGEAGCDQYYFFDAETGAKIEMGGQMAFFTSTVPLVMDVPRLQVEVTQTEE